MTKKNSEMDLREHLIGFEEFAVKIGFKRIHGSIFGYLVLSEIGKSSVDIEKDLGLSQSAVSQTIKFLTEFNAIYSQVDRDKNVRIYTANDDFIEIVASIFRRRELESIIFFKKMMGSLKSKLQAKGYDSDSIVVKRLESILKVCKLGEVISDFILKLNENGINQKLDEVTGRLSYILKFLSDFKGEKGDFMDGFQSMIKNKINQKIKSLKGDHYV